LALFTHKSEEIPKQAPSLFTVWWHVWLSIFIFDTLYYFWHYAHHNVPFLFKHFHATHHQYQAPWTWIGQYVDSGEFVWTSLTYSIGPSMLRVHPLTLYLYTAAIVFISLEEHSGYEFPWMTHKWALPFGLLVGRGHDLHHRKMFGNYGAYFTVWDRLFGTTLKEEKQ